MEDHRYELIIRFEDALPSRANQGALDLRRALRAAGGPEVTVDVRKEDSTTQDFGSTLVVLLGTPAVVAIAQGVRDYIAKWGDQVVIETPDGKIIARGDGAHNLDVAAAVAALQRSGAKK